MLNHSLGWYKWVLNEVIHPIQWFNTLIPRSLTIGSVAYTLFGWSRTTAPVELPTRYITITADRAIEIGGMSATVEYYQ